MSDWKPAHTPPEGLPGKWTKDVVAVTNLRNVYRIAYFCPERGNDQWRSQRERLLNGGHIFLSD